MITKVISHETCTSTDETLIFLEVRDKSFARPVEASIDVAMKYWSSISSGIKRYLFPVNVNVSARIFVRYSIRPPYTRTCTEFANCELVNILLLFYQFYFVYFSKHYY